MLNLKLKQNVYRQRKLREVDGEAIQKLTEIGQDLKSLINTDTVFDENEKLLDNQDLAFLLKASFRTLQRYRAKGVLPYFTIGRKRIIKPAISGLSFMNMPILKPTSSLKSQSVA